MQAIISHIHICKSAMRGMLFEWWGLQNAVFEYKCRTQNALRVVGPPKCCFGVQTQYAEHSSSGGASKMLIASTNAVRGTLRVVRPPKCCFPRLPNSPREAGCDLVKTRTESNPVAPTLTSTTKDDLGGSAVLYKRSFPLGFMCSSRFGHPHRASLGF